MTLNNPESTQMALSILRSGEPFEWYVVSLLGLTLYAYINEISKRNWKVVAGGLALYCVYDWKPAAQRRFLVTLFFINLAALILFAGVLGWI